MNAASGTVTLHRGRLAVSVRPTQGGVITRFWQEGEGGPIEWMRPAPADNPSPLVVASFPLVPFSGRIRNGRFRFGGREVQLPLNFPPHPHAVHGQGWKRPWEAIEQGPERLIIQYNHTPDAWPWAYEARQVIALTAEGLANEISVTNRSAEPMPAGIGVHPYFLRTTGATITAAVHRMWHNDAEVMPLALIPPPAEKQIGSGVQPSQVVMDNTFTGWSGRAVIDWPEWQARLTITAEPPLRFLVVYTPQDRDFFCVEPVSNVADAFNLGGAENGLTVLQPGETLSGAAVFRPDLT